MSKAEIFGVVVSSPFPLAKMAALANASFQVMFCLEGVLRFLEGMCRLPGEMP